MCYFWSDVQKPSLSRWTTWLMRPVTSVKGQTLLSAMSTTILNIMDSQKLLLIFMLISVQDKTKTTILCGTWLGGLYYSFIIRIDTLFWLQDTPSLAPIVVLVLSKNLANWAIFLHYTNLPIRWSCQAPRLISTACGDTTVIVPVYDWSSFLEEFF